MSSWLMQYLPAEAPDQLYLTLSYYVQFALYRLRHRCEHEDVSMMRPIMFWLGLAIMVTFVPLHIYHLNILHLSNLMLVRRSSKHSTKGSHVQDEESQGKGPNPSSCDRPQGPVLAAIDSHSFRGIHYCLIYYGLHESMSIALIQVFGKTWSTQLTIYVILTMVLSPLHMLWIQQVVAAKSFMPRYSIHDLAVRSRMLLVPSGLAAVVRGLVALQNMSMAEHGWNLLIAEDSKMSPWSMVAKSLAYILGLSMVALAINVVIALPAMTLVTRLEAALLPSDKKLFLPIDWSGQLETWSQTATSTTVLSLLMWLRGTMEWKDWWLTATHYSSSITIINGMVLPFINVAAGN